MNFLRNKKGQMMTAVEVTKIVLSIIGISILVYLLVSMYGLIGKRNEEAKFVEGLDEMVREISKINSEVPSGEIILLEPKGWYLHSFHHLDDVSVCNTFCVCFCDEDDCDDKKLCKETPKFVSLKNSEGEVVNYLEINGVTGFSGKFIDKEAYPYRASKDIEDDILFYQYFDDIIWKWTLDPTGEWTTTEYNWSYNQGAPDEKELSLENHNFLAIFHQRTHGDDKDIGVAEFGRQLTRLSRGIIELQQKGASS